MTNAQIPAGLFKAVNVRDVRMVQRGKCLRFTVNRASLSGSFANESGRTFSATSRLSFVSRARKYLSHPTFADGRGDRVDAKSRAGGERQLSWINVRDDSTDGIAPQ
jgi:hypothetical protein